MVNVFNLLDTRSAETEWSKMGSWCSGITFALQAKGPGFDPRRIHFFPHLHQIIPK